MVNRSVATAAPIATGKMRRGIVTVIAAAVMATAMAFSPAATPPAEAAPALRFTYAQYNSPGKDTGSASSLNAEYITIKNAGNSTTSLKGWTIRDKANHVFTFGDVTLKPGATMTVHTGGGAKRPGHRHWGKRWYVWNNAGDTATLKNASGATVDTCSWGAKGSTTTC